MKRFILFLFLFLLCIWLFFSDCGGNEGYHYYYKEEEIIAFVQENKEEILQQIEDAGEDDKIEEFDGIERVEDRRDSYGVIYYKYAVSGILTSSLQAGFYYSIEDMPSSYGGAEWACGYEEVPTQKENLWQYEEDGGDNYLLTRKICDNFYYVLAGN